MNVTKQNLKSGSCNFCTGKVNSKGSGSTYDYTAVFLFTRDAGSGLGARICKKCLNELKYKADRIT